MYQITTTAAANQTIIYLLLIEFLIISDYKTKNNQLKSIIDFNQCNIL
jgi:hypothetical protein